MEQHTKAAIKTGLYFGLCMGIIFTVQSGSIVLGFLGGLFSGVFYGIAMGIFTKIQAKKSMNIEEEMSKKHNIIYDDAANYFMGKKGVEGWLFLTENSLIFKPYRYNIQKQELVIPITSIQDIKCQRNFANIKNGISISMYDGEIQKFVVNSSITWLEEINELVAYW